MKMYLNLAISQFPWI